MDDFLTVKQLQDLLQVDRTTIYRMLNDGRLTGIKVGGQWRFARQEVEATLLGTRPADNREETLSTDILPLHCLQAIQNVFAEVAGIGSVTAAPDGEPLTEISNSCRFCNFILESPEGRRACIASWRKLAKQTGRQPDFMSCHAGLQYARAPIEVDNSLIAVLIAGQFYSDKPEAGEEADRLRQLAEKFQLDPAALADAVRDVPVLDERMRARIGSWLEDVAHERAELMGRLRRIAAMSALDGA
jgi:excisionase family DNA binding protein